MDKSLPVTQIMTKKVVVANLNNKFSQVRKLFLEYNLHHLPVTSEDGHKIIGIISQLDVIKAYNDYSSNHKVFEDRVLDNEIKLEDIMTTNPDTIHPDDTIKKAAEVFAAKKYHALPVADDGIIKGIVTSNDLIKFILD